MTESSSIPKPLHKRKFLNQYELYDEIKSGGFAKVYFAIDTQTKKKFAIKVENKEVLRSTHTESYFIREAEIILHLDHPNIVHGIEFIDYPNVYALVLEFVPNGDLFDEIIKKQKLVEEEAHKYFKELVFTVEYLHENNIVHRDLKAENILIGENKELKICDFGLARYKNNKDGKNALFTSLAGSEDYVAPEIIKPNGYKGCSCDIWSLGVLLFFMLFGYLPFSSNAFDAEQHKNETYNNILKGQINWKDHILSSNVIDLLKHMLTNDPTKRYTINDIILHSWFAK
jgi:serine/threonine protein kinase